MKKKLIVLLSVLGFMPLLASAQSACTGTGLANAGTIQSILCRIGNILDILIPILVILGVVYFIWGVITYFIGDDEEAKKKGRDRIIYGLIGLVVIVAMWGLVGIVLKTFNVDNSGTIPGNIPNVPF